MPDARPTQPWIGSAWTDTVFILLPPFLSLAVIALFPALFQNTADMPETGWVALVLLVDVAHVYSTLYRTYFDPEAWKQQGALLRGIPLGAYAAGVLVYSISGPLFWRLLAYIAVFHFVRQQYGFLRIYSRKESKTGWWARIDRWAIYGVTLYPLLWWHLQGPRHFNWFLDGDFVFVSATGIVPVLNTAYVLLLAVYLFAEGARTWRQRRLNVPRLALVSGTAASWYFGIVYFNGDMAFTITNVVSHGIPYMALVWLYGRKRYVRGGRGPQFLQYLFKRKGLLAFVGLLFVFAFVEEGLWDLAVWKEHPSVFGTGRWPQVELPKEALAFLVPLLALPQLTHYILDGFIWKIKEEEFRWKKDPEQTPEVRVLVQEKAPESTAAVD
ncbi:hypothetical protein [Flaviaesturariibacter amylovorans]|uniref:Lycopene cyclase domain-containing protein n=1 Tax=Flaviaesturariibacter amylovorans TaxID=1084520 RepID=A0ABP8GYK6_9BACT